MLDDVPVVLFLHFVVKKVLTYSGIFEYIKQMLLPFKSITYFLACYKLPPFIYLAFVLSDPSNKKDECVNYPETVKKCSTKRNFYSGTIFYTYKPKWFILETYKVLYIVLVILSLNMQPPTTRWLLEYKLVKPKMHLYRYCCRFSGVKRIRKPGFYV